MVDEYSGVSSLCGITVAICKVNCFLFMGLTTLIAGLSWNDDIGLAKVVGCLRCD